MEYDDLDELDDDFEMMPPRQNASKMPKQAVEYFSDSDDASEQKESRGKCLFSARQGACSHRKSDRWG